MKNWILAIALVFALSFGICGAEETEVMPSCDEEVATEESAGEEGGKGAVFPDAEEESVDHVGTMSPEQSYDDNTGLPDVVNSDSDMEIQ